MNQFTVTTSKVQFFTNSVVCVVQWHVVIAAGITPQQHNFLKSVIHH